VSSAAELTDPLISVRHRAPALSGTAVDYGLLTDLTGFSVRLVWVLARSLLTREFGVSDITPHRYSILEVIGRNPGLQQSQLAAALALTRPATTLAVDFWEKRGCVERRKIVGDRRSFGVYPTLQGERELARLRKSIRKADAALTAGLTEAETRELRRLLEKIHK
jgi:DNA-binding MarR family transcriptional regulator